MGFEGVADCGLFVNFCLEVLKDGRVDVGLRGSHGCVGCHFRDSDYERGTVESIAPKVLLIRMAEEGAHGGKMERWEEGAGVRCERGRCAPDNCSYTLNTK